MKPATLTLSCLAAAALALPTAVVASAAPPSYTYDAIGDSYAAGSGALAGEAYPERLDGRMRITLDDFAAKSGAAVTNPDNSLTRQLGALGEDTDLVTLTIGGNDIPWSATVIRCLAWEDDDCLEEIADTEGAIDELPAILDGAYDEVREAAPNAHIVVTGYARLFSPEFGDYQVPGTTWVMSVQEQNAANQAADRLNQVIAEAAGDHGFEFVDVTKRFDGHGANADEPWLHGFLLSNLGWSFHPNAAGYDAYAAALTAAINPRDLRR